MFILDTDFIFSYFDSNQSTHLKAVDLVEKFGEQEVIISNIIKQELATVISNKIGQIEAKQVLKNLELFEPKEVFLDHSQTDQIWKIFWSFKNKSTSFADCSNLFLAQKYNCKIASFDNFYPNNLLLGRILDFDKNLNIKN